MEDLRSSTHDWLRHRLVYKKLEYLAVYGRASRLLAAVCERRVSSQHMVGQKFDPESL